MPENNILDITWLEGYEADQLQLDTQEKRNWNLNWGIITNGLVNVFTCGGNWPSHISIVQLISKWIEPDSYLISGKGDIFNRWARSYLIEPPRKGKFQLIKTTKQMYDNRLTNKDDSSLEDLNYNLLVVELQSILRNLVSN